MISVVEAGYVIQGALKLARQQAPDNWGWALSDNASSTVHNFSI
jgi:hypothetical protein